jgi:hypothetical protein
VDGVHEPKLDAARTVVLVEGVSDQLAIEALARRLERDLGAEGIAVLPMGGSKNVAAFIDRYGPHGAGVRLAGLCDAGEERDFARALERAGLGSDLERDDLERLGFFVCVQDLEDELIRALGVEKVEAVLDSLDDLAPFRTFQKQPEWRDRPEHDQLRRFLGAGSGRKALAAPALVGALDLARIPKPLDGLLTHLSRVPRADARSREP